ncbi:Ryanodine receptor [Nymphon striatum]|nr:Ryanodine receptor [Nymphon striatum]
MLHKYLIYGHYHKREEQNFITAHEIDNMALIMPSTGRRSSAQPIGADQKQSMKKVKRRREKKRDKDKEVASSLMVACLKRLLPVGLNLFAGREQELVQNAKEQFLKRVNEADISDDIKMQLTLPDKIDPSDSMNWQHHLYSKLGSKKSSDISIPLDTLVERIIDMAKVLYGLHVASNNPSTKASWQKLLSSSKKRAAVACLRSTPLYRLKRHSAINIFLGTYKDLWLQEENTGQEILIEDLTQSFEDAEKKKGQEEPETKADSLSQLVENFCRSATTEHSGGAAEDPLYMLYAEIISNSCSGNDEEEDEEGDDDAGPSIHEQEMEKQKLLFEQARLADRGVAEMVLLQISASKGISIPVVMNTLKLGISLLRGGNVDVQKRMLKHLKDKKDVGFFTSISILMNQCSVLNLDAFERNQKAEGLGVGSEGAAGEKNMHDAEVTCTIFRFLQLLCEGHNLEFQNYLRTQAGNTTTVNVVICTVDYLLRLQESVMDFYWHYSSKDIIDPPGKENFGKAITVAKQVFNTLTEYLQGPCPLNQQALAHSRLWDAVTGFLFLFAHMQYKLAKHSSQLDVLCELLELQKEMVIMMLSMLEGNIMNGTIGKQMLDTLVESASNVEMILKFFNMFLKLKDLTSSSTFHEADPTHSGFITPKEFKRAMEQQKSYNEEDISFLMVCAESNHDEKIDYIEFTERFHNNAKEIGFALAVLLTNLSEHITNDPRLSIFLETAGELLTYFEPYLGRIEIMGGGKRIERVYFEIKDTNLEQWGKPQIKESKRAFFYGIVTEGGDKEKLEAFVNFCEDAIFEMQHASNLTMEEEKEVERHVATSAYPGSEEEPPPSAFEPLKQGFSAVKKGILMFFSFLAPSNLKNQYHKLSEMTYLELLIAFCRLCFYSVMLFGWSTYFLIKTLIHFLMLLMVGQHGEKSTRVKDTNKMALVPLNGAAGMENIMLTDEELALIGSGAGTDMSNPLQAFGLNITRNEDDGEVKYTMLSPLPETQSSTEGSEETLSEEETSNTEEKTSVSPETQDSALEANNIDHQEKKKETIQEQTSIYDTDQKTEEKQQASTSVPHAMKTNDKTISESSSSTDIGEYGRKIISFLARNFYTMKYIALSLAFLINFFLLFFQVTSSHPGNGSGETAGSGENEGEEEEVIEFVKLGEKFSYLQPLLTLFGYAHALVSFSIVISYYNLKVPLGIFKREKEIARSLEFDGRYITTQGSDEDFNSQWDKLVISSRSFPVNYWDKFVKKRVKEKFGVHYDPDSISRLLGMDSGSSFVTEKEENTGLFRFFTSIDWRYQLWKFGVTVTDNAFLYNFFYFVFSILGIVNNFFFAAHLIDVAIGFKTLRTILQSVTHNGKQLVLTLMLLMIVVYMYTVIAFNFFRKFYIQEEDDAKCHNMFTCFMFHLYKGVRAGGGIGDEIEAPDGDEYEAQRILFDFTFFFFVIVILLAIIQGLIIDAFGELRDQLQSVSEDMEANCFICGIGKDYFDKVPHGFDTHVSKEHDFANYMFFLMHLINKPDTEYTGQETYVWELYQNRCWDFFPVGDCFRKQYEDELVSTS